LTKSTPTACLSKIMTSRDWDDDEDSDWSAEDWSDDGNFDDEDETLIDCPECGAAMSDDIDKCPKCGYWLSAADRRQLRRGESRPAWQKAIATLLIAAFILCLILAGLTVF
jgi:hypothetical protein